MIDHHHIAVAFERARIGHAAGGNALHGCRCGGEKHAAPTAAAGAGLAEAAADAAAHGAAQAALHGAEAAAADLHFGWSLQGAVFGSEGGARRGGFIGGFLVGRLGGGFGGGLLTLFFGRLLGAGFVGGGNARLGGFLACGGFLFAFFGVAFGYVGQKGVEALLIGTQFGDAFGLVVDLGG